MNYLVKCISFIVISLILELVINSEPLSTKRLFTQQFIYRATYYSLGASLTLLPSKYNKISPAHADNTVILNDVDSIKGRIPYVDGAKMYINGKITTYKGDVNTVTSPIIDSKTNEQTVIGRIAQFNKDEALRALISASNAWDSGQGRWPQMSSKERIVVIERVIASLREKREEIVNILMWEICKTRKDSEIEFGWLLYHCYYIILS